LQDLRLCLQFALWIRFFFERFLEISKQSFENFIHVSTMSIILSVPTWPI